MYGNGFEAGMAITHLARVCYEPALSQAKLMVGDGQIPCPTMVGGLPNL